MSVDTTTLTLPGHDAPPMACPVAYGPMRDLGGDPRVLELPLYVYVEGDLSGATHIGDIRYTRDPHAADGIGTYSARPGMPAIALAHDTFDDLYAATAALLAWWME